MAKKKNKTGRVVVLPNGETFPIVNESGKYWIAEDRQFRKGAFEIREVEEKTEQKEEEE